MKTKSFFLLFAATLLAQTPAAQAPSDPKDRVRAVRELAKSEDAIPAIAPYARDVSVEVRLEAVKQLNQVGGPRTIPSLLILAGDTDAEIQINAVDGLINVFLPGYLKNGVARTVTRSGNGEIKAKFTDNLQVVDGYVTVPQDVSEAVTKVLKTSKSSESRANAARALGIFRARSAVGPLGEALYSKDDLIMYESVIAIQKIRDPQAGASVAFLVRDLNEKIQTAALRTAGILRAKQAAPAIRGLIEDNPKDRILREAVSALAMIAEPADRGIFLRYLAHKDSNLRASSAEGLARIKNPADLTRLNQTFNDERDFSARLAMAFALTSLGRLEMNDLSPFRYLVDTLNRNTYRTVALAYLIELARDPAVRQALVTSLGRATPEEKSGFCIVMGESGGQDSLKQLQTLKDDPDPAVSQACLRGLRTLEARVNGL